MRRRAGPVQQWVDSIPVPAAATMEVQPESDENRTPPLTPVSSRGSSFNKPSMTISTPIMVPSSPIITKTGVSSPATHNLLARDPSFQSDSSHCSSVESLLELRKADPEAVLLGLGFGGCPNNSDENGPLSRIPKRFLQPSKLQGITINDFVKHEQETSESLDSASLGYRGLTGSPYVAPSEIVQKIMERLREHESHEHDAYTNAYNANYEPNSPVSRKDHTSRLSVLSPDNRQFLDRPRSRSPDMRNKRMIIGQKSFAFGCDGDLIEIESTSRRESVNSSTNGNADNHEIELEDKFVFDDAVFPNETTSTTSKDIEPENKITIELFVEDSAREHEETVQMPASRMEEDETERNEKENKRATFERRSSLEAKKTSWPHLSREIERRNSDGCFKKTTTLFERRKSFKRQSRISDVEFPVEEGSGISEGARLEDNETDRIINRSDRLSAVDVAETMESSAGESSTLDVEAPTTSANSQVAPNDVEVKDSSKKKRDKKGQGLSAILGMYNSVMSIKMEPGF